MKIEILKDGLLNGDNMKPLKKGDVIEVTKERGEKAIKLERAKEVKPKKKKSQQKKIEDKLEKK